MLDEAADPSDLNVPGFNVPRLQGRPVRYGVHVNGPWCVTFDARSSPGPADSPAFAHAENWQRLILG